MAAENRLTGEQLGGLSPGDPVVIEVSGDMRRPRRRSGTIVRIEGSRLVVSTRGVRDGIYIEYYSLRDGLRLGRGATAQLVHDVADAPAASDGRRRQMRVDAAYRAWTRNRSDLQKLRELHASITDALDAALVGSG